MFARLDKNLYVNLMLHWKKSCFSLIRTRSFLKLRKTLKLFRKVNNISKVFSKLHKISLNWVHFSHFSFTIASLEHIKLLINIRKAVICFNFNIGSFQFNQVANELFNGKSINYAELWLNVQACRIANKKLILIRNILISFNARYVPLSHL